MRHTCDTLLRVAGHAGPTLWPRAGLCFRVVRDQSTPQLRARSTGVRGQHHWTALPGGSTLSLQERAWAGSTRQTQGACAHLAPPRPDSQVFSDTLPPPEAVSERTGGALTHTAGHRQTPRGGARSGGGAARVHVPMTEPWAHGRHARPTAQSHHPWATRQGTQPKAHAHRTHQAALQRS